MASTLQVARLIRQSGDPAIFAAIARYVEPAVAARRSDISMIRSAGRRTVTVVPTPTLL